MPGPVARALALLDLLARHPGGLPLAAIARALDLAPSAAHRLLNELATLGHVRQIRPQGEYALTLRLPGLGLAFLARAGVTGIARPVLDRLAAASGELVRLALADGDRLVWVAVAQGATHGLRYDPAREQGEAAPLAWSASGRAWLATLPEDRALALAAAQGLAPPPGAAPGHALTVAGLAALLAETRARGHALAVDCFLAGMAAVAVALPGRDGASPGTLSVAGPSVRLTPERIAAILPGLRAATAELADLAGASALLAGGRAA